MCVDTHGMNVGDFIAGMADYDDGVSSGYGSSRLQQQQVMNNHRAEVSREALTDERRITTEMLQDKLEKMQLVNEALWEIVKASTGATDDNLRAWIAHLDGEDGQVDGRRVHRAEMCNSCQSRVPVGSPICVYCSEPAPAKSPFAF